jgi:hypothetical protein
VLFDPNPATRGAEAHAPPPTVLDQAGGLAPQTEGMHRIRHAYLELAPDLALLGARTFDARRRSPVVRFPSQSER